MALKLAESLEEETKREVLQMWKLCLVHLEWGFTLFLAESIGQQEYLVLRSIPQRHLFSCSCQTVANTWIGLSCLQFAHRLLSSLHAAPPGARASCY